MYRVLPELILQTKPICVLKCGTRTMTNCFCKVSDWDPCKHFLIKSSISLLFMEMLGKKTHPRWFSWSQPPPAEESQRISRQAHAGERPALEQTRQLYTSARESSPGNSPHFPNFHLLTPHRSLKSYTKYNLLLLLCWKQIFNNCFLRKNQFFHLLPLWIWVLLEIGALRRTSFATPTRTARIASVTAQNCLITAAPIASKCLRPITLKIP